MEDNQVESAIHPMNLFFLLFYIIVMVLQFVCMLVHRWTTLITILSETPFLTEKPIDKITDGVDEENEDSRKLRETSESGSDLKAKAYRRKVRFEGNSINNPAYQPDDPHENGKDETENIEMQQMSNNLMTSTGLSMLSDGGGAFNNESGASFRSPSRTYPPFSDNNSQSIGNFSINTGIVSKSLGIVSKSFESIKSDIIRNWKNMEG